MRSFDNLGGYDGQEDNYQNEEKARKEEDYKEVDHLIC